MTEEFVLYSNPQSRGGIARWMLEEVGRPYRVEVLDFGAPMASAAYRAVNPMGKVPALRRGDLVVTEAAAICAWLADACPEAGLAPPPDAPARAEYFRWLFFAAGPLEQAVTNRALGVAPAPEQERMVGYGSMARTLDALEGWLEPRDHVAGGRFSAADVYVGAQLGWGLAFGTIEARPAFRRYADAMAARPAARRAAALDGADWGS